MSKMKQILQTRSMELLLTIRQNIKGAYTIIGTHYRGRDELLMVVSENIDGRKMHYEIIIRPQPYMDPGHEK